MLIARNQVLDFPGSARDRLSRQERHIEGDKEMFDPGALGTLIIGLRARDADLLLDETLVERGRARTRSRRPLRASLARAMHSAAERLYPGAWEPRTAH